ncbi:hypothetical protein G6F66_006396 [Rhizopus arrhizus]|nr:hypothetical protein G6F66_006396 [Rhizopus arrhizus]
MNFIFYLSCIIAFLVVQGYCLSDHKINQAQNLSIISATTYPSGQLRLTINAFDTNYDLHLEPNHDLFHPQAVIYQDGQSFPMISEGAYKGHVNYANTTLGWARILIQKRQDQSLLIEGAFRIHEDIHHIKSRDAYHRVKRFNDPNVHKDSMVVYRNSGTIWSNQASHHQCGINKLPIIDEKRDIAKRTEKGCPIAKKINYMGVAADCTYVQYYKSKEAARLQILNDFNIASALFEETFNVALGLINMTIMDPLCPSKVSIDWNRACEPDYSLYDRLSDFSLWRNRLGDDGAGLWHLMTNCPVGLEVGLAWLGQVCNTGLSEQTEDDGKVRYVSGTSVSSITQDEWKIVAHEIGHSFGAIHDCNASSCPCSSDNCASCCSLSETQCSAEGAFIMNPTSNSSVERFSPCSINTVCSLLPSIATCLSDPQQGSRHSLRLGTCGNGIREEGEDCDTGGKESDCCDVKTCKFINHAVCEDLNDACCHQCQVRPSTFMCRPSLSPCDQAEYCTGTLPTCPPDRYEKDGTICSNMDSLRCASGQCTSRDQQCLARGYTMNITRACSVSKEECKMLCEYPDDSTKCTLFSADFLDGTLCGTDGKCLNGLCLEAQGTQPSLSPAVLVTVIMTTVVLLLSSFGCWLWIKKKKSRKQQSPQLSACSSLTLVDNCVCK